eukprot:jgi/Chlat1/7465/Chrsp6S07468
MADNEQKYSYDEQGKPNAEDPMERVRAGGHKGGVRGGQVIHEMAAEQRGQDPDSVGKYTSHGEATTYQKEEQDIDPTTDKSE